MEAKSGGLFVKAADEVVLVFFFVVTFTGIAVLLAAALLPWSRRPLVLTDGVTIGFGTVTGALLYLCLDGLLGRSARVTDELRIHP